MNERQTAGRKAALIFSAPWSRGKSPFEVKQPAKLSGFHCITIHGGSGRSGKSGFGQFHEHPAATQHAKGVAKYAQPALFTALVAAIRLLIESVFSAEELKYLDGFPDFQEAIQKAQSCEEFERVCRLGNHQLAKRNGPESRPSAGQ